MPDRVARHAVHGLERCCAMVLGRSACHAITMGAAPSERGTLPTR
jgi:hypothetical protein